MILSTIKQFLNYPKYYGTRTFTYYIPAPPLRKNGYHEKEFDQVSSYLLGKNFDIIDFKTEACANERSAGMWIVCILGAKTKEAATMILDIDYSTISSNQEHSIKLDPSIEHDF